MRSQNVRVDRDPARERRFIEQVAGGHVELVEQVTERLEAGEALYGDRWATVGICRLLRELQEEAADLVAWGALAEQALDLEAEVDKQGARHLRAVLIAVAERGAVAYRLLTSTVAALEGEAEDDEPQAGEPVAVTGGTRR